MEHLVQKWGDNQFVNYTRERNNYLNNANFWQSIDFLMVERSRYIVPSSILRTELELLNIKCTYRFVDVDMLKNKRADKIAKK